MKKAITPERKWFTQALLEGSLREMIRDKIRLAVSLAHPELERESMNITMEAASCTFICRNCGGGDFRIIGETTRVDTSTRNQSSHEDHACPASLQCKGCDDESEIMQLKISRNDFFTLRTVTATKRDWPEHGKD